MKSYGKRSNSFSSTGVSAGRIASSNIDTDFILPGKRTRTNLSNINAAFDGDDYDDKPSELQHSQSEAALNSCTRILLCNIRIVSGAVENTAAMCKQNSESSLPTFPSSSRKTGRSTSRGGESALSRPSVDLFSTLKQWKRSGTSADGAMTDEPTPSDIVIGVRNLTSYGMNQDGGIASPMCQNYTLAEYIDEVQESFACMNEKLKTMQTRCAEFKQETGRVTAERDYYAAQVKSLQATVQSKKESAESMALVPKLIEKTNIQQKEISRYVLFLGINVCA